MNEERTVLVGAGEDRHLDELERLAKTLGMTVVARMEQNRRDNTGYLGKGKRRELGSLVEETRARFVVADDELTASQARVLEKAANATIVDRTELIIRIFESHARDAASRLQAELADLEYRLPRVKGRNPELSRLGGGVGTRGPGEQQLEYDRRVIRERIGTINRKLRDERAARAVQSSKRRRGEGPPRVALVGYTNAGKTTILNALSGADRSVRDWLFETLETTTRLVEGGTGGREDGSSHPDFVVTDTVGFIRKLPTQLVHSFASTLEAASDADVLVICADASSERLDEEIFTVRHTLQETLKTDNGSSRSKGQILCLNKVDLLDEGRSFELRRRYPEAVLISALQGDTAPLKEAIYAAIEERRERMEVLIPHSDYAHASRLYGVAEIHASKNTNEGLWMDVSLPRASSARYEPYRVD